VRKITRDLNEDVRDRVRALANTEAFQQSCAASMLGRKSSTFMAIPCRHELKRILLTRRRVQARADSRSIGWDVCGGGMADLGDRNATL
jgi:hypothetical protein